MEPTPSAKALLDSRPRSQKRRDEIIKWATKIAKRRNHQEVRSVDVQSAIIELQETESCPKLQSK